MESAFSGTCTQSHPLSLYQDLWCYLVRIDFPYSSAFVSFLKSIETWSASLYPVLEEFLLNLSQNKHVLLMPRLSRKANAVELYVSSSIVSSAGLHLFLRTWSPVRGSSRCTWSTLHLAPLQCFFQVLRAFNLVLKFAQVLFFSRQILLLYSSISANYDHSHPCHTSHAPWEPCLLSLTQSVT